VDLGISDGTESKTTKIGLVNCEKFNALDIPGYNDANTT
jgi:hypothetical protein